MKPKAMVALQVKEVASGWTSVDFVDKKSGKFHRIYKYKNKPCKSVYLKSKLVEQMAGYSLIEKDLRSAIVWIKKISEMVGEPNSKDGEYKVSRDRETYNIVKGLFVAALTFYGKCFSKCDGRPVKLERKQVNEKFLEVHDTAISYRHNFAAHSGAAKLEFVNIALVIPEKVKYGREIPVNLYTEINQPDLLWQGEKELGFVELFEHVREFVKAKIQLLSDKIMREEVLPKGPDNFFK
ncbi:hypothetical protein [Pseudomonas putida]|uniref:hypothetical protein n=1 Tax=Pseudomonas putida TaxID=303 RepID=UPI00117B3440|nr:hypothetical protein [Pseudomonas putida]